MRGPSGLGASRAEEKGASRLAQATWPLRFFTDHDLSSSLAVRHFLWSEPGPLSVVFTNHETRITAFFRVLRLSPPEVSAYERFSPVSIRAATGG